MDAERWNRAKDIFTAALERDLIALIDRFNRSGDSSMVVPSEFLEIVITRH